MNARPEERYIFITPFVTEIERILESCSGFVTPEKIKGRNKSADLKKLLSEGKRIVTTHSLFSRIDPELIDILDEVMDVVHQKPVSPSDFKMLCDSGYLEVQDDMTVKAGENARDYKGKLHDVVLDAKMDRLICADKSVLMWQFPVDVLEAFREVIVLTYMFDGQYQKYYFDFNEVEYDYYSVCKSESTGMYELTDYDKNDDKELRDRLKDLINIYEGPLNSIGDVVVKPGRRTENALSVSWYNNRQNDPILMKAIQNGIYNYFHNIVKGNAKSNMWTCFKDQKELLKGNRYTKGFVTHNKRATNDYRERSNLAYMVNRYPNVIVNKYFQQKGIMIDQDLYGLSELIQWIFRSSVRDEKPINLHIPSYRMRRILKRWLAEGLLDQNE